MSVSGQTLTYTVTSPVSVPAGVYLRLEIWRISNPATPSNSLQVQIATKTSGGSTIDTGTSTIYFVRQIATGDIANNAITTAKIAPGAVTPTTISRNNAIMVPVDPHTIGFSSAFCNSDEVVTGGGYQTFGTPTPTLIPILSARSDGGTPHWHVQVYNSGPDTQSFMAQVECMKLSP